MCVYLIFFFNIPNHRKNYLIISTFLLCFSVNIFVIKLYFKTYIKFKSNYQKSLKLPKYITYGM